MAQAQIRVPQQLFVLAGCLRRLGVNELQEITERIGAQKRIYLLQVAGLDLRYQFTWDLFGPFSRGLANDMAAYRSQAELLVPLLDKLEFTETAKKRFEQADRLIAMPDEAKKGGVEQLQWLEFIASLHFVAMNQFPQKRMVELSRDERMEVVQKIAQRKPHLKELASLEDVAWERLTSGGDNRK